MVKQLPAGQPDSVTTIELSPKQRLEQARMSEVLVSLEIMFTREEATVKQILDCLYDIASVNFIDRRVNSRWLNRFAKWAARYSKPVFRIIALRWFKRNCPQLITNWLYTQTKLEMLDSPKKVAQEAEIAAEAVAQTDPQSHLQPSALKELEGYRHEVRQLHSQVKLLTTLLIGVTVTLGSGLAWSLWRDQTQSSQQFRPAPVGQVVIDR